MQINKVFRKLRREKEWTLEEVAMRLGVSNAMISDFEAGKRDLKSNFVNELCRIHKIPLIIIYLMATETKDQKKVKEYVKKHFK